MKLERTILINKLIRDNSYKSYLEIGLGSGENFNDIELFDKVSVDPNQNATYILTSDEFFKINDRKFDIIFVDGLHLFEQAYLDVINSLDILNKGGVIVIHDCLPNGERNQLRERVVSNWQGDVWKAIVMLAKDGYSMKLLHIETGIVLLRPSKVKYNIPDGKLNWNWFVNNFKSIF